MLSIRLREFLLGGPIERVVEADENKSINGCMSQSTVLETRKLIESESQAYVSEWKRFENEELKIEQSYESVLQSVKTFRSKVDDPALLEKIRSYTSLQNQVQLLILAKNLSELRNFSHVRDIPDLVHNLMDSLPNNLPSSCMIYNNVITTVKLLKSSLLQSFHKDFDEHLETNADSSDAKEMWSTFLGIARDWLLAYALVSLIPSLLSDSRNSILEKYTEALDEVLTPLWGRFHFHLSSARESKSFEQFVWTFSYAKSFLTLLIDLSTQLTSAGQLEKLYPGKAIYHNLFISHNITFVIHMLHF